LEQAVQQLVHDLLCGLPSVARRIGTRDDHRKLYERRQQDVSQNVLLVLVEAFGRRRSGYRPLERSEGMAFVDLTPAHPAEHGGCIREHDTPDCGITNEIQERTCACTEALDRVGGIAGSQHRRTREFRLGDFEDRFIELALVCEVVIERTLADRRPLEYELERRGLVAVLGKQLAGNGQKSLARPFPTFDALIHRCQLATAPTMCLDTDRRSIYPERGTRHSLQPHYVEAAKGSSKRRQPSPAGCPEERYVADWKQGWSYGAGKDCLDEHATTIRDENTLYIQPLFDAVAGEQGMRRMFGSVFALIPDLRVELDNWAVEEGVAFIEFTLSGTIGERPIQLRGVDRMHLDGDKLVLRESYFDPLPILIALLTRPRAWPRALRGLSLRTLPRLRPTRIPLSR
jgi:hypothetical protein